MSRKISRGYFWIRGYEYCLLFSFFDSEAFFFFLLLLLPRRLFSWGWAGQTLALFFHWSFASRAVFDDPFASLEVDLAAALNRAENPALGPGEESRYRLDESIIICISLPKEASCEWL